MVGALALLAGCLGATTQAQLRGRISLTKEVYLAGEPIYVLFEFTNVGKDAVQFTAGDPYSDGCGGYSVEVSKGPTPAHSSCEQGGAGECIVSTQILSGGATQYQNILVNYAHNVSKSGDYEIHAAQALNYGPITGDFNSSAGNEEFKVEARFQIRVIEGDRERLEAIYRPYVTNLVSKDAQIQRDAERAIVSGSPAWLEDTILGMLRQYTSREFALLGLKNLNTARSREELAKIVQRTSEFTQENERAVGYLAQMGDKKYFPLLREIAQKQPPNQARDYVSAAAELGGEDALPFLSGLMSSADPFSQSNGVMGLEKTGSRMAVPLLIETLKKTDLDLGKLALIGLTGLTHRTPFTGGRLYNETPWEEYGRWAAWWLANGSSAPVYGPRQCGEIEMLP